MVITIDGPVASGKSTVAQQLARRIGFYHFSSGMLYRALGYLLVTDAQYTQEQLYMLNPKDIDYYLSSERFICKFDSTGLFHIFWQGVDIIPFLKYKQIDCYASIVSTNRLVREYMLNLQRLLATTYNLVIDGRDSGSVVFPNASLKFFLIASVEERTQRWKKAQQTMGNQVSLIEAMREIENRDKRDKNRDIAPLIIPQDAIVIDNSKLTIQETVNLMVPYFEQLI